MRTEPKFKVGDTVQLVGIYKKDKGWFKKTSGRIISHFTDPNQIPIGGSYNGYVVEGLGTYGEGALEKIK